MAIANSVVLDIRTTGAATNGGGFRAGAGGTDYSQQDAAQIDWTDLVINAAGTGVASTLNPVVAAHDGNCIYITGGTGFTVGRYEIVSISGSVAILDRSPGTALSVGGTGKLGGAVDKLSTIAADVVGGNKIYIKSGTYLETAAVTIIGGSSAVPTRLVGWETSRTAAWGDFGVKPIIRANASIATSLIVTNFTTTSNRRVYFFNLDLDGNALAAGVITTTGASTPGNLRWCQCIIRRSSSSSGVNIGATSGHFDRCRVHGNNQNGVVWSGTIVCYRSRFDDNGADGCGSTGTTAKISAFNCVFAYNIGNGLKSRTAAIYGCTLNNNSGSGFHGDANAIGNTPEESIISNTIIWGNGAYGINPVGSTQSPQLSMQPVMSYLAMGSNTSGNFNILTSADVYEGFLTLTGSPFTAPLSNDYSLNNTAGAGAVCRAAGMPGLVDYGTGYEDIGPLQHQDAGGGSSHNPFHSPLIRGVLT